LNGQAGFADLSVDSLRRRVQERGSPVSRDSHRIPKQGDIQARLEIGRGKEGRVNSTNCALVKNGNFSLWFILILKGSDESQLGVDKR